MDYKIKHCNCLPNCNLIQMDTSTVHMTSEIFIDLCSDTDELGVEYVTALLNNVKTNELYETMKENELKNVHDDMNLTDPASVCNYLLKNEWAYVMVSLKRPTGIQIMKDVRVTFIDRIAAIGKFKILFITFWFVSLT